jgi:hypothetical protein
MHGVQRMGYPDQQRSPYYLPIPFIAVLFATGLSAVLAILLMLQGRHGAY